MHKCRSCLSSRARESERGEPIFYLGGGLTVGVTGALVSPGSSGDSVPVGDGVADMVSTAPQSNPAPPTLFPALVSPPLPFVPFASPKKSNRQAIYLFTQTQEHASQGRIQFLPDPACRVTLHKGRKNAEPRTAKSRRSAQGRGSVEIKTDQATRSPGEESEGGQGEGTTFHATESLSRERGVEPRWEMRGIPIFYFSARLRSSWKKTATCRELEARSPALLRIFHWTRCYGRQECLAKRRSSDKPCKG